MVGILILTHGDMAKELLAAARRIAGPLDGFEALALGWNDTLEHADAQVTAALKRLDSGHGVLVLTDIFGGTPSNIAMKHRAPDHIEVISGVNLPMVVRLGCQLSSHPAPMPLSDMTRWIEKKAQSSICSSLNPRSGCAPQDKC
ncbi:MAG: PTS sugar transporter subunit IIA [Acidobacteriota bacterium]